MAHSRADAGEQIARTEGQVRRVDDDSYFVHSQFGDWEYQVNATETGWVCTCPDYSYRFSKCKHIFAVEFSRQVRQAVKAEILIEQVNVSECQFCHSLNLKRFGVRRNKSGDIQRFLCADCQRTFSVNIGFDRMKHNPKAITTAMQLYFNGESLRNTAGSLRLIGAEVSYQTVWNWIQKYVGLMDKYLESIIPNVGETWRTDELYLKVKGNLKYLYAMMDDETRYWIAQEVADTKYVHDARSLFRRSKEIAGKKPLTLITDGAQNYRDAFRREFYTNHKPQSVHIRDIRMSGHIHNNIYDALKGYSS